MLSMTTNMLLIGNINDIKAINRRSGEGNVWSNLYLQTYQNKKKFDIEGLIDALAIEMFNANYRFTVDKVIDITPYTKYALTPQEINYCNSIIVAELEVPVELNPLFACIKRNSLLTQPDMVEIAMAELNGFAYANDILEKIILLFPEKEWTMSILRASFRGDRFYSVGKSGLFGLTRIKDLRNQMGNGTLNEIIKIYMSEKDFPIHYYELLQHINSLFPRPKNLHAVHSILQQNSRGFFKSFTGGYYGLAGKDYIRVKFLRITGGHSIYLRQVIRESNGIRYSDIYKIIDQHYNLEEIQVQYMLHKMLDERKVILQNGKYYLNSSWEIVKSDGDKKTLNEPIEEIDVEIDQDEIDFDELDQPDFPQELLDDAVAQIKIRRGQPMFRRKLLKLYKNTCIVTGCKIAELLEAAHITPHSEEQNYNLSNGLLLRADIHTLFDLGMIAIEPESMHLKLNPILFKSEDYCKLENVNIGIKISNLNVHYKLTDVGLQMRWRNFVESE